MWSSLGLRARILIAGLLMTLAAALSAGLLVLWMARYASRSEHATRAIELARSATLVVASRLELSDPKRPPEDSFAEVATVAARAIRAQRFDWIAPDGIPRPPVGRLPTDTRGIARARAEGEPVAFRQNGDEGAAIVVYLAVRDGDWVRGIVRVVLPEPVASAALGRARLALLFLVIVDGLILFFGATWLLRRDVVRPVLALEATADRVAAGNLAARVTTRGPGELGLLADAFDRMTASLSASREAVIKHEKLAGVGRLAAGIAHEIGNPLAAVIGYADLLVDDAKEGGRPLDATMRRDIVGRVHKETQRINGILRQLLDLARPPRVERQPVDLAQTIEGVTSLARATGRAKGIDLEVHVPDDLPRPEAAADQITQILLNLVLNAADATGGNGKVWIAASSDERTVRVAVEDDGPGIPPAQRRAIFDPFFTTKEPGKGTGLGLAVSLALAEGMGGALRVETRDAGKQGARFVLELPRRAPPTERAMTPVPTA